MKELDIVAIAEYTYAVMRKASEAIFPLYKPIAINSFPLACMLPRPSTR